MRMRSVLAFALAPTMSLALLAQSTSVEPTPSFEVASIKPTKTPLPGPIWSGGRRQQTVTSITPVMLIRGSYDLHPNEVFGVPAWAESEQFDISASFEGDARGPRLNAMMRSLLAERFALKAHRETRESPKYRLVLSRNDGAPGPQLVKSVGACGTPARTTPCGMRFGDNDLTVSGQSVRYFLNFLESVVGRRIDDQTGLEGDFEFRLVWRQGPTDLERSSIFTALQEQLGFKLEATRGPVSVLIIDSIERPTPD